MIGEMNMRPPGLEDMLAAHERTAPHMHRTPVLASSLLNEPAGAKLFFRCANLQKAGVCTHPSGSHVLSLPHAAGKRGMPCHVMPHTAPRANLAFRREPRQ